MNIKYPKLHATKFQQIIFAALFAFSASAQSEPSDVAWADWTDAVTGSASGIITSNTNITVSYSGEVTGLTGISWLPFKTFAGGNVGNAPEFNDIIGLNGGNSNVNTITFSSPVVNPVMSIWSLGAPGIKASFVFPKSHQPVIQSGGPNNEYGGTSIQLIKGNGGSVIWGKEGNGTIQFIGKYTTISWTNPQSENWYGFTVGVPRSFNSNIVQSVGISDLNGNNIPEEATLAKKSTNTQVFIRDAQTKSLLKTILVLQGAFTPLGLTEVPDVNSNGKSEIAVMYRDDTTGEIKVAINDSWDGTALNTINFGLAQAKSVTVLKDSDGNGVPEIAVTALPSSSSVYQLDIRDAVSGVQVRSINLP